MTKTTQPPLNYGVDAVHQMLLYKNILNNNPQPSTKLDFGRVTALAARDPALEKKFSASQLLNSSTSMGGHTPTAAQALLGLPTMTGSDTNVSFQSIPGSNLKSNFAKMLPQLLFAAAQQRLNEMRANCFLTDVNGNVSPQSVNDHSSSISSGLSSMGGEHSPGSSYGGSCRKSRTVYEEHQIKVMERWFNTRAHYIVGEDRIRIAQRLHLSESQIRIWFQNRRSKWRKENAKNDDVPSH